MPSHRLVLEANRSLGEWLLAWDASMVTLALPDGEPVLQFDTGRIHHVVDLFELDYEARICFKTPDGELKFKRNKPALRDVRALVLQGMRADPAFRARYERIARVAVPAGMAAFVICGGLFGLYCWWASWAPDPPAGSWFYYVGALIHVLLLVLLAGAIGGPLLAYHFWRRVRQLRRGDARIGGGRAA